MISKDRYEKLKKEFGKCASWAIWEPEGETPRSNTGNLAMFGPGQLSKTLQCLNPEFIVVGLNCSVIGPQAETDDWRNFHSTDLLRQHDHKMRKAFLGTPVWGAYMTDIIKCHAEVDSQKLMPFLRKNPGVLAENLKSFSREVELLGTKPTLIALGNLVYDLLAAHFSTQCRIVKIKHYATYSSQETYRDWVQACFHENGIL